MYVSEAVSPPPPVEVLGWASSRSRGESDAQPLTSTQRGLETGGVNDLEMPFSFYNRANVTCDVDLHCTK